MKPIITLTSDFGVQSQGIGIMEGTILDIVPNARIVHLMHGIPDFDIRIGARTMETVKFMPIGFHVCVVDPGVGTPRRGIAIKVKRGDYLVGPDNGVLMSAVNFLGGFEKAVELSNTQYMRQPVSPVFHGRDVFSPAAAHLYKGVALEDLGKEIPLKKLTLAPYAEATLKNGVLRAEIIHINKFGSAHLNVTDSLWDRFLGKKKGKVVVESSNTTIQIPVVETFGHVKIGQPLIFKDDYGRIEIAVNRGNFCQEFDIKLGDKCLVSHA